MREKRQNLIILKHYKKLNDKYRKSFVTLKLFTKVTNNAIKQIISLLPVRILEDLYKNQDILKQIDKERIEYKETVNFIKNNQDIILIEDDIKTEKVDF